MQKTYIVVVIFFPKKKQPEGCLSVNENNYVKRFDQDSTNFLYSSLNTLRSESMVPLNISRSCVQVY